MAYRRERNIRDIYEERFIQERAGPYPRAPPPERRQGFGRPEEEYGRGFEYENSARFYPNGGAPPPRSYHGEEQQRGYHGGEGMHFPAERRAAPPARREEPYLYRGPREEPHTARPMEFSSRAAPPPPVPRAPPVRVRTLPAAAPEVGVDDTLMQAILNLDRSEERDSYRRKGPSFPPMRERSPLRRDVPPSPHSRSGSSVSSRGYSPDRAKGLAYAPQNKSVDGPEKQAAAADSFWGGLYLPPTSHDPLDKDRVPGLSDGSPQSPASASKEEPQALEGDRDEGLVVLEEGHKTVDDFQERRAQVIAAKAEEIEKVFQQDCETFGMVVRMLISKDAALEKALAAPLNDTLGELRERCLDDLKHFITELDEAVRQDPAV